MNPQRFRRAQRVSTARHDAGHIAMLASRAWPIEEIARLYRVSTTLIRNIIKEENSNEYS